MNLSSIIQYWSEHTNCGGGVRHERQSFVDRCRPQFSCGTGARGTAFPLDLEDAQARGTLSPNSRRNGRLPHACRPPAIVASSRSMRAEVSRVGGDRRGANDLLHEHSNRRFRQYARRRSLSPRMLRSEPHSRRP
jgi:hypothetical protein